MDDSDQEYSEYSEYSEDEEAPSPTTPILGTPPIDINEATTYEHVYCGGEEGQLTISPMGVMFDLYIPGNANPDVWVPNHIGFGDIQQKEFRVTKIDAQYGQSEYSTQVTLYEYKLEVYPSKEVLFQLKEASEFERLQCDMDARGHGAPVVEAAQAAEEAVPVVAPGFHADDYDGMPDVAAEEEAVEDEDVKEDVEWQQEDEVDDAEPQVPWSAADAWNAPDTAYYPVLSRQEIGTLKLNGTRLQFVPDRHSSPVQSLPWASFAGKPFFSPYNYPQAIMHIHYHTTRGPHKKAGFDLDEHTELKRLQGDITARLRPFHNLPREKVYVPPVVTRQPQTFPPPADPFKDPAKDKSKAKAAAAAPFVEDSHTTDEMSSEFTSSEFTEHSEMCGSAAAPLVVTPGMRRNQYHKEERPRRMWLLFMSYCCIVTLTGLTLSILFGYYFGPRETRDDQYVRTKAPGSMMDYLGTAPPTVTPMGRPTFAPTPKPTQSFGIGSSISAQDVLPPQEEPAVTTTAPSGSGADADVARNPETLGEADAAGLSNEVAPNGTAMNVADEVVEESELPVLTTGVNEKGEAITMLPTAEATTVVPETLPPTAAPTVEATRSIKSIVNLLMEKSPDGGENLRTMGTPQQAAYLLLVSSGALDDAPSDEHIQQKYSLASLYYSTGGENWNLGKAGWKSLEKNDCVKTHLVCNSATQKTIWVDMPENNMRGKVPAELSMLTDLEFIDFSKNDLQGSIPTELGALSHLKHLDLSGNPGLTGTVPVELLNLPSLTTLTVDLPPN